MSEIGPQRVTPSSPAKVAAEVIATRKLFGAHEAATRLRLYWDVEVTADYGMDDGTDPDVAAIQYHDDVQSVVDAFYDRMRVDERQNDPPTREMFDRLANSDVTTLQHLVWHPLGIAPIWLCECSEVELDTIAKLRAACLLLGIETEGVL